MAKVRRRDHGTSGGGEQNLRSAACYSEFHRAAAFPWNGNGSGARRLPLEETASARAVARKRRCSSVGDTPIVSVSAGVRSTRPRRGTREQRAQEAQPLRRDGFAPTTAPRRGPRLVNFFSGRFANRQARCVRRYVISWQIGRPVDRY